MQRGAYVILSGAYVILSGAYVILRGAYVIQSGAKEPERAFASFAPLRMTHARRANARIGPESNAKAPTGLHLGRAAPAASVAARQSAPAAQITSNTRVFREQP